MDNFVETKERKAREVWNNKQIPVFLRRGKESIRIRLPYDPQNRLWLRKNPAQQMPVWNDEHRYWELPKSRFNELVELALNRYGRVYIIQPYREMEKCSPSCMSAKGFECQCSCMGANHGSHNHAEWFEVNEAFAFKFGERHLACRLLEKI